MKIDLVYLWCDGSDIKWRERRNKYLEGVDTSNKQVFCEGRITDNDDLLYSLRSVEMYAPWINHIYIVTDNQSPEWLNLANSRVTIVDHRDIFEEEVLPLYNSGAIELGIHKIKGLSEHYIYANDDMMFGRAVTPDFFFTSDGKAICRVGNKPRKPIAPGDTYAIKIDNLLSRFAADYGEEYRYLYPRHNIDSYIKSCVSDSLEKYHEWRDQTLKSRFRTCYDMQRHLFLLFTVAAGRGVVLPKLSAILPKYLLIIAANIGLKKGVDSSIVRIKSKSLLFKIRSSKPALLCFNDTESVRSSDRDRLKKVYQILYPQKSTFEK